MSGREILDGLARVLRRHPPAPTRLPRAVRPTLQRFKQFRRASQAVLLGGLADDWPDRQNLSLARLRERFGNRLISGMPTKHGQLNNDPRAGVIFETVRFGDYVDRLERGDWPEFYLAAPGETWFPELRDEVRAPEYCRDASWRISRIWLSAPQMSAPLHRDVAQNIFVQLIGRKRFYLYPAAATPWLYSNPVRSALPNYSRFDPEKPDYERFPLSRALQPLEVILEPGDAIYLPSGWWHQVRSLDVSLSVSFFFADGALAFAVRAAEFVKRMRGLEIYGLETRRRASLAGSSQAQ